MKSKCLSLLCVISVFSLVVCIGPSGFARHASADALTQEQAKPKVSEEEAKAAAAINAAPDAGAKLAAAGEFLKKYPKSTLRLQIASYVAGQIAQVADATQRLTLAEGFQKVFKEDKELEAIQLVSLDAYLSLKRVDDAFAHAALILAKEPENVAVMSHLAIAGTEEAKRQNAKHVPVSLQYGLKAIELIEANKKPAYLDDASWESQKSMLPLLYLDMGILSLVSGKPAEAKPRFEKAAALNPAEPTTYALLGNVLDDEYQQLAEAHRTMPAGKQKDETLKKATELMDKVIDLYARSLGASAGKPEHKPLKDQLLQIITPYYKYRHNGSTDGLQQLIDKYKAPATP
jgi:tetratricopeptide (TPR) repeat protein